MTPEWEDITEGPLTDGLYYTMRHKTCGTSIEIQGGRVAICPKCQPEKWAASIEKSEATR